MHSVALLPSSLSVVRRLLTLPLAILGLFAFCVLGLTKLRAADAAGKIVGRVSSAGSGAYLEGADVLVAGRNLSTLTLRDGSFSLTVPVGMHTVNFHYTGLMLTSKSVSVAPGQTVEVDVALSSDVQLLQAFTVSSSREGEAASVTKQRNADNIVNVVSMDAFGNVADGNIGNFMVRLPGVSADYENGEVIGIKIRGAPPEFNAVNVDGIRAANASVGNPPGDRSAEIDTIPAEFIKEVEVTKAPTPDMPADSIGGSANLVTKSALDFDHDVLTYRVGYNYNSFRRDLHSFTPNGAMSWLTRLGARRSLGLALSLTYTETEAPRDRVQMTRTASDGKNTLARTLTNVNNRVRIGIGTKFDYRFNDRVSVYAKLNYNYYDFNSPRDVLAITASGGSRVADYSQVSRAQIQAGNTPRDSANATAGIAPGYTDTFTEMLAPTFLHEVTNNVRRFWNFTAETGGTIRLNGDQQLILQGSYNPSGATGTLRLSDFTYTGAPFGLSIDTTKNRSRPEFRQTYGPNIGFGSDFSQYTATFGNGPVESNFDNVYNAKADYIKDFKGGEWLIQFKSGFNWREQQHRTQSRSPTWNFVGADGVAGRNASTGLNDDNLAQFRTASPTYTVFNYGGVWPAMDGLDFTKIFDVFNHQPELFKASGTTVSAPAIRRRIEENVYAGYLQGRIRAGRFTLLGGGRFEETEVEAFGTYTDSRQPTVLSTTRDGSYGQFFPSVHAQYRFTPNLIGRTSFSTGAARPNMSDLYPNTTVSYNATTGLGTVTTSNPGLKPQTTRNYDVSLEYYVEPAGVIAVGAFRKDIKDFISRNTQPIGAGADNGFDGNYAGFDLNTTDNLGSARIEGVELSYNQQLTFLPKPFNTLRIFANYTKLRTSGTYANGVSELVGFVPKTANLGASWRWRKLELRTAWNYSGTTLRSYSANIFAAQHSRPVETVDVNLKYYFNSRINLFIDAINIDNHWQDLYTGTDPSRVVISDSYGSRFNFGLSGRF